MSLAEIKGKLSRQEMKNVLAGRSSGDSSVCCGSHITCSYYESGTGMVLGTCEQNSASQCVCKGPRSSIVTSQCGCA